MHSPEAKSEGLEGRIGSTIVGPLGSQFGWTSSTSGACTFRTDKMIRAMLTRLRFLRYLKWVLLVVNHAVVAVEGSEMEKSIAWQHSNKKQNDPCLDQEATCGHTGQVWKLYTIAARSVIETLLYRRW